MSEQYTSTIGGASASSVSSSGASGGGYTSAMPGIGSLGIAPGGVENTVRSLLDGFKDRREQRLEQLRNPPGNEPETALLCWGKAPPMPNSATNPTGGVTVRNRKSTEEPVPPEEGEKIIRLNEQRRYVEEIKIASEGDEETFIVTHRARAYVFSGSNGYQYEMVLTPDGNKCILKKGAKLPARL